MVVSVVILRCIVGWSIRLILCLSCVWRCLLVMMMLLMLWRFWLRVFRLGGLVMVRFGLYWLRMLFVFVWVNVVWM